MALSKERKLELARMTLPTDAETVKRATAFRQRSGLTFEEFSMALGYSPSSLSVYLQGRYGNNLAGREESAATSNTRAIRYALKQFMDLYEGTVKQRPMAPSHKTKDFVEVRRACMKASQNGTAYVIDGPPGSQKTFSLQSAVREINERTDGSRAVYVYARVDHAPQAFLQECCNAAGISSRGMIDQLIRKLGFFLSTGDVLFVVDEAQHLEHKCLEVLRQLLDQYHFGVIMAGSDDLARRLDHWQMERWRSRVRKTLYLNGPSVAESRAIIRAELEPLLGPHTDAQCDGIIDGCYAEAERACKTANGDLAAKKFRYVSARNLFFTIEDIQQVAAPRQPVTNPAAPQKESAA
jgi:DNA transposition AAA+ family ATPase